MITRQVKCIDRFTDHPSFPSERSENYLLIYVTFVTIFGCQFIPYNFGISEKLLVGYQFFVKNALTHIYHEYRKIYLLPFGIKEFRE